MKTKSILITAIVIITLIGLNSSVFIVEEKDQVIITQFGKPVGEAITTPGLHYKVPLIQDANYFEKRVMEWNGDPNQVPTKDKKFIFVDKMKKSKI